MSTERPAAHDAHRPAAHPEGSESALRPAEDPQIAAGTVGKEAGPVSVAVVTSVNGRPTALRDGYTLIAVPAGFELHTLGPEGTSVALRKVALRTAAPPAGPSTAGRGARPVRTGRALAASARSSRQEPPGQTLAGPAFQVFGVMLMMFAATVLLFGHVKHARDQSTALSALRADLANGTAPVEQTSDGTKLLDLGRPLGLIEIPALGLSEVYLEGTTSGVLESGPGHRRDTVMPGQLGTSVIFGRRTAFGGPFSKLPDVIAGTDVYVTDGLGRRIPFKVVGLRRGGDPIPSPPATGSRITLVTASGGAYAPEDTIRVDADLVAGATTADKQPFQVSSAGPHVLTPVMLPGPERAMGGDIRGWLGTAGGLTLLLPLTAAVVYARREWGRWQAWVSGFPALFAVAVFTAQEAVRLMPNLM